MLVFTVLTIPCFEVESNDKGLSNGGLSLPYSAPNDEMVERYSFEKKLFHQS